jgi:hypothetical protein
MRDVLIRSGDGAGLVGLDLGYTDEQGPCLIKNVSVRGFDVGISSRTAVDSIAMEFISLEGQNKVGLSNDGQVISIRGLKSSNKVPAISNRGGSGLMVLIDSELTAPPGTSGAAIGNTGSLFARDVSVRGYAAGIESNGQKTPAGMVAEFSSAKPLAIFPSPAASLRLPIKETPLSSQPPLSQWVSPAEFGAVAGDKQDDTEAVQKAIDSGRKVLYLPAGTQIDGEVLVRGGIERITALEGGVHGKGRLKVIDGAGPTVVIDRMDLIYQKLVIEQASSRTLVLSGITTGGELLQSGTGDIFLEDFCGGHLIFRKTNVWARQLNVENQGLHILNEGGSFWVLGYKTERGGTLLETTAGGRSEILGSFVYATTGPKLEPMYRVVDASLTAIMGEACFNGNPYWTLLEETRQGETRSLYKGQAPARAGGSMLPLLSARPVQDAGPVVEPVLQQAPPAKMPRPGGIE